VRQKSSPATSRTPRAGWHASARRSRRRPPPATALAHIDGYVRCLRRELEATRGEHARAAARHGGQLGVVDAAQGRLRRARAEREIIERHFAAWRAEHHKRAERRAD
jgi:hypothetical protein